MEGQACQRKVADVQRCVSYVIMTRCNGVIISQDGGSSMSEKSYRRSTLCIVCYYEK